MVRFFLSKRKLEIRDFSLSYGFAIAMGLVFIYFSIFTNNFLTLINIMNLMHAAAPMLILSSGLALVIMLRELDISVGSVSFITAAIGSVMMVRHNVSPILSLAIIIITGLVFGALNGLFIVIFNVNSFIATLGTMIAYRGIALQISRSRVISMPNVLSNVGNIRIGPVYIDILISLAFILFVHSFHRYTRFGRYIMAIGSSRVAAARMGIHVKRIIFLTLVLSSLFASISGIFSMLQLGAVTLYMGKGLEFIAIAAIVIGGISLFGGEGRIIPGLLLGVYTLAIIDNGLNHAGASPFIYPFVRGGIIFIAMYADSLRSRLYTRVKLRIN